MNRPHKTSCINAPATEETAPLARYKPLCWLYSSKFQAKENFEKNYRCYEELHPFSVGCNKILGGWAVGSTGIKYPEKSGFAVGSRDHPQYAIIEMHYDNLEMRGKLYAYHVEVIGFLDRIAFYRNVSLKRKS